MGSWRLRLDHHGQGPVYRLAFDMPAREARELEEVMGVGGFGHLAETQIEPLGEEDVQESDPIFAWRARAQVRESVGETGGGVHLQQDIGDPHLGQATIEVEHELIDVLRHCGGGPADPEFAILDGAAGYPAVVRGIGRGDPGPRPDPPCARPTTPGLRKEPPAGPLRALLRSAPGRVLHRHSAESARARRRRSGRRPAYGKARRLPKAGDHRPGAR